MEDDRIVWETIMLMLEDDYEVIHAGSVPDALALLGAAGAPAFDLMLLDCLLPGGGVPDALAAADARRIPVLLTSGDPNQAEAVGPGRAFLPKPFSRSVLLSLLDSAVR